MTPNNPRKKGKRDSTQLENSPTQQEIFDNYKKEIVKQLNDSLKELAENQMKNNRSTVEFVSSQLARTLETVQTHVEAIKAEVSKVWAAIEKCNQDLAKATNTAVATSELSQIKARLNASDQEKLNNCLDISGIPNDDSSQSSPNVTAKNILKDYDITNFSSAYWRRIITKSNERKSFLVVTFSSYEDKMLALQRKRDVDKGKDCTIYFNHSLTSSNRLLFMNARKIAKSRNLNVYISHGRIFIKNAGEERGIQVRTVEDLTRIDQHQDLAGESLPNQSPKLSPMKPR